MQNAADTIPDIQADFPKTPPVFARYELRREIGQGGMSVVYEAYDRHTEQTVALKVLNVPARVSSPHAEILLSQFLREARVVAGLAHPNIIAIYDSGEESGNHFLVMEFLQGETLRERLRRGPMTPDQAEPVLRQMANALDVLHARGIVHQDIKPSNIMLMRDGTAKLLDFGGARFQNESCADQEPLIGSPAYLSPEQLRGETGTPGSDIWAFGTLLYEMLSSKPPFVGKSVSDVLHRVTHELPTPIPDLSPTMQRVLHRALDKNPLHRYPTAGAMAAAFRASLPSSEKMQSHQRLIRQGTFWLVPILLGITLVFLSRFHPQSLPLNSVPLVVTKHIPVVIGGHSQGRHFSHHRRRYKNWRLKSLRLVQKLQMPAKTYAPVVKVIFHHPRPYHTLSRTRVHRRLRQAHPAVVSVPVIVRVHSWHSRLRRMHQASVRHRQRFPLFFSPFLQPRIHEGHKEDASQNLDNLNKYIYSPESP